MNTAAGDESAPGTLMLQAATNATSLQCYKLSQTVGKCFSLNTQGVTGFIIKTYTAENNILSLWDSFTVVYIKKG